jgi:hypothetical protein
LSSTPSLPRRKLPIGIQTFRQMRQEGYYYVDKTQFAWQLTEAGKYYFLSRPRRFGKSLFLDTLAELFAGSQDLFQGLYICDRWDWSRQYLVIRLSFGGGIVESRAALEQKLEELISRNATQLGVTLDPISLPGRFQQLIQQAHQHSGQRVVILVDEYDKPILDNLSNPDTARDIRDGLRSFYSVIKDSDAHVQFVLLTGVSKFSKVSLFSGLNNLQDITVDSRYSALCGYTEADVDTVFAPELEGLDRAEIRHWYNGYNWTGEAVYNPFDLLLLFSTREFRPYWFETGTPTFLVDLLTRRHLFTPDLERLYASSTLLSAFDVDDIASSALLWQTGYLTLAGKQQLGARIEYALTYPNLEVKSALSDALLKGLMGDAIAAERGQSRLFQRLQANDIPGLRQHFASLFASIPHDWYRNNPIAQYEGYYASVFYSHIAALGLDITLEDATHQGQIDMTLKFNHQIYLFEFKVVELTPTGSAIAQLQAKQYADKYRALGQPIYLIGIEFSKDSRTITGFDWQAT